MQNIIKWSFHWNTISEKKPRLPILWLILLLLFFYAHLYGRDSYEPPEVATDSTIYYQILNIHPLINSDPALALDQALDILAESKETQQKRVEAIANAAIGVILRKQGLYPESLEYYMQAMDYLLLTRDSLKTGWFYLDIGNIYFHQKLYQKARENYQKSLVLYSENFAAQATSYNNLALIAKEEGDFNLALKNFLIALSLREKIPEEPYLIVHSYQYIGDLLYEQGDITEAMEYYNKILSIGVIDSYFYEAGLMQQNIGEINYLLNNNKKGMSFFKQAEQSFIKTNKVNLAQLYLKMAKAYKNGKQADSSLLYLNKAYQVTIDHKLMDVQKEVLNKIIDFYLVRNAYYDAIHYCQLLKKSMQDYYNSELNKSLQGMETQLKLVDYKRNLAEKESIIKNNLLLRNITISIGLLLLSFLFYLYLNMKTKKKTAVILHQQKQTLLQQELKMEQLSRQKIQTQLETKQREIVSKATMLLNKNDQIKTMHTELKYQISLLTEPKEQTYFKSILSSMHQATKQKDSWKEFETHFVEVFPSFLEELSRQFPKLTSNDLKFCAYIKMNLNTKEIAALTSLTVRSVESRRYRLHKKLKLSSETSLIVFLHSLS